MDGALIVFCGSSGYPVQLSERPKNAWLKVDVTLQITLSFVQYDTNVQLNIVVNFFRDEFLVKMLIRLSIISR